LPVEYEWYRSDRDSGIFADILIKWLQIWAERPPSGKTNQDYYEELSSDLFLLGTFIDGAVWNDRETEAIRLLSCGNNDSYLVYSEGGREAINEAEYQDLRKRRGDFDLFLDGQTGDYRSRSSSGTGRLKPGPSNLLVEYICTRREMNPNETVTRSRLVQHGAGGKVMFNTARRAVDWKVKNRFVLFQMRRVVGENTVFRFQPPDGVTFRVIVPVVLAYDLLRPSADWPGAVAAPLLGRVPA
jgi:hypothetical protein